MSTLSNYSNGRQRPTVAEVRAEIDLYIKIGKKKRFTTEELEQINYSTTSPIMDGEMTLAYLQTKKFDEVKCYTDCYEAATNYFLDVEKFQREIDDVNNEFLADVKLSNGKIVQKPKLFPDADDSSSAATPTGAVAPADLVVTQQPQQVSVVPPNDNVAKGPLQQKPLPSSPHVIPVIQVTDCSNFGQKNAQFTTTIENINNQVVAIPNSNIEGVVATNTGAVDISNQNQPQVDGRIDDCGLLTIEVDSANIETHGNEIQINQQPTNGVDTVNIETHDNGIQINQRPTNEVDTANIELHDNGIQIMEQPPWDVSDFVPNNEGFGLDDDEISAAFLALLQPASRGRRPSRRPSRRSDNVPNPIGVKNLPAIRRLLSQTQSLQLEYWLLVLQNASLLPVAISDAYMELEDLWAEFRRKCPEPQQLIQPSVSGVQAVNESEQRAPSVDRPVAAQSVFTVSSPIGVGAYQVNEQSPVGVNGAPIQSTQVVPLAQTRLTVPSIFQRHAFAQSTPLVAAQHQSDAGIQADIRNLFIEMEAADESQESISDSFDTDTSTLTDEIITLVNCLTERNSMRLDDVLEEKENLGSTFAAAIVLCEYNILDFQPTEI